MSSRGYVVDIFIFLEILGWQILVLYFQELREMGDTRLCCIAKVGVPPYLNSKDMLKQWGYGTPNSMNMLQHTGRVKIIC